MGHQAAVEALVGAGFDKLDLAAAALFSRSSKKAVMSASVLRVFGRLDLHDPALDTTVLQGLLDTNGSRHAGSGNEVVAASMANAGEGVVFRVEGHGAALAVGELGLEGGAEVVGAAGHGETLFLEEVGEDLVSVDLLVAEFRVLPDLEAVLARFPVQFGRIPTSRLIVFRPSFCASMAAKTESARPSAHEVLTPRARARRPKRTLREDDIFAEKLW